MMRGGWLACTLVGALTLAACGSDDDGTAGAPTGGSGGGPTGGSGGTGSGGTSGSSGTSGSGGTAGEGGTSGSGGSAGTGGDGGIMIPDDLWEILQRLTPLPDVPADTTNSVADNAAARTLGQRLFFDKKLSGPIKVKSDLGEVDEIGKVSCASCHQGSQLDDQRSQPRTVSLGADFHSRNAPALVNSSFYQWTNWGGRFSAQWELPLPVSESGVIMNSNRLKIVHRIFDAYRGDYEAIFGPLEPAIGNDATRFPAEGKPGDGTWDNMAAADQEIVNRVFVNFGKVLQAYVRQLVSRNAPFDRFIAGDTAALSDAAIEGAMLFASKARCASCHSGPHFSDGLFHNLGVPQEGEKVPASDDGRYKDAPGLLTSPFTSASSTWSDDPEEGAKRIAGITNPMPESTRAAFRTPTVRGVEHTAPYMHSGQIATLEDVIEFYNSGGGTAARLVPLHLTEEEASNLLAFLKSLTGDAIPAALLQDTSAP